MQESANYTCRAIDLREKHLQKEDRSTLKAVAEITVLVNVAKNIEETCPKDVLAGKVWPVTLKGEVATTTCLDGVGREVIKCNPVPGWPPTKWDSISSQVECVRHTFIQEFDRLRR